MITGIDLMKILFYTLCIAACEWVAGIFVRLGNWFAGRVIKVTHRRVFGKVTPFPQETPKNVLPFREYILRREE